VGSCQVGPQRIRILLAMSLADLEEMKIRHVGSF
jgi:hypothetical protein